jgi:hypothetical protein
VSFSTPNKRKIRNDGVNTYGKDVTEFIYGMMWRDSIGLLPINYGRWEN